MIIDKEFKSLIFSLSKDELAILEENIIKDGCRDALVVWKEEDILLDGHNRYEICTKHKIDYKIKAINLPNRMAAADWIDSNQLGRRNLSPDMMRLIRGRLYNRIKKEQGGDHKSKDQIDTLINSADKISKQYGISSATIKRDAKFAKEVESDLNLLKAIQKRTPINKIKKEIKKEQDKKELKQAQDKITDEIRKDIKKICDIRHCSMKDLLASEIKPDCIITDPPYPKKFLELYGELAEYSRKIPFVAVMVGQSYLPEILSAMCKHLKYRWTLAYLTPGGQAVQQWETKINAFWKPVLLFGESIDWIGDVCRSDVNDNDKRFHGWGQSESGMADLIERLSKPDQLICDPFVGGGTTALISLRLGRRFVGCDIDENSCKKAIQRCEVDFAGS